MDLLIKYLDKRYTPYLKNESTRVTYAPFITISREYGCPSYIIAKHLVDKINEFKVKNAKLGQWSWINKEIVEKSAASLNISEKRVNEITHAKQDSVMDDIFNAFSSRYYPNDIAIRKSIKEVIHSFALKGNIVIVGRAGVAITSSFQSGIHIRLKAPLKWRIERIVKKSGLNERDAMKVIAEKDTNRAIFRRSFKQDSDKPIFFDLTFNCERLSVNEIVTVIIHLMQERKIL